MRKESSSPVSQENQRKSEVNLVRVLISIIVGVVVALLPPPEGLTSETMRYLGVFAAMIVGLLSRAAPNWLVTITCCMSMILLGLSDIGTILSNFSSQNIWLPLAIVGFAGCLEKSGVLRRIAFNVYKLFPASYTGQVLAVSAASLVLTPLVPSTSAKLGVLSPFTASLAGEAGIQPHSRGMKGLWFVLFNICYVSAFCVLTGSNGNFLILGFAPEDQAAKFTWLYWLLMCVVWLVIMVLLSILFVIIFMKPEQPITVSKDTVRQRLEELGPMSKDEKFCVAVLVCAVALWITESYHGIGTVVVAWAALLAMMVRGLFTSKDISRLPWQFFMFLAGLLGMADYMGSSGVSEWFSGVLAPVVGRFIPNSFVFVIVLVIVTWLVRLFVDSLSTMAIIPTVFGPIATLLGINPLLVVWLSFVNGQQWVLPHNTPQMLQSAVMMGNAIDHEDVRNLSFVYMVIALIGSLVSVPVWSAMALM